MSSSHANLLALIGEGKPGLPGKTGSYGQLSDSNASAKSERDRERLITVSNQLPIRMKKAAAGNGASHSWEFEWDEDSLVYQAKAGIEQPQFDNIQVREALGIGASSSFPC